MRTRLVSQKYLLENELPGERMVRESQEFQRYIRSESYDLI